MRFFGSTPFRYALAFLVPITLLPPAFAAEREALRVCADPNNLPFSNQHREGFENRLAELLAADMGIPVNYTWFPQRIGFIRNTLRATDPDTGRYKCDIVMGVPAGFELTITTKPYYRSTYALVYVTGGKLDGIRKGEDLLNLDKTIRDKLRIGIFEKTPAATWLARHGMRKQMVAYQTLSGDPAVYPGEIIEKELIGGKIDAAIVWGPIAGFFTKRAKDIPMTLVPLVSEPGVKFDFAISAGARFGEGDWKREIEALLERNAGKIDVLLREYNVPLVSEDGSLLTRPASGTASNG